MAKSHRNDGWARSGSRVQVSVQVDSALLLWLRERAREDGRSLSGYIEFQLHRWRKFDEASAQLSCVADAEGGFE